MGSFTIHDLWSRRRRLLGMFTAVVVGVAFLAGTLVLADSVRDSFGTAFAAQHRGTDAVVRNSNRITHDGVTAQGTVPAATLTSVAAMPGVQHVTPMVEGTAQLLGGDGDRVGGTGPPTVGANWTGADDRAAGAAGWHLVAGRAPAAPGEVVIDRASADDGDLHVGSRTTVLVPQAAPVTVVGIARFGDTDTLAGTTYTAFTLGEAQRLLLGGSPAYTSLLVTGTPGTTPAQLAAHLRGELPTGLTAITARQLTAEDRAAVDDAFLNFFETLLLIFAGVALLVAAFSIHNTFAILAAQRTREAALLRSLGASRRQLALSAAAQGLLVGATASAVGVAVGIGIAAGLYALLTAAGLDLPDTGLVVEPARLAVAAAVGVLVTVPASVMPAIRASRVQPIEALREGTSDTTEASRTRRVFGVLVTLGGIALVVLGGTGSDMGLVALGALALVVGLVAVGPVLARPAVALLGAPGALLRGTPGSLARRNAMRNPRATAGAATALMIGVTVVTVFTVFASSIKASIGDMVHRDFTGDLVVVQNSPSGSGIDPALLTSVRALPQVREATGFGIAFADVAGEPQQVAAASAAELDRMVRLHPTAGSFAAVGDTGAAVSARFARDHGLAVGSPLAVRFGSGGTANLTVAALYDRASTFGDVVVPESVWAANTTQAALTGIFVRLAPGVALDDGRRAVTAVTTAAHGPEVQDAEQYLHSVSSQVDMLLAIVAVFLALAVLIAFMGIANTLSLAVFERTRELGLLRAIGLTRSQVRTTVRWESLAIAALGAVTGIAAGTAIAWGMVRGLHETMPLDVFDAPAGRLATIGGIAVLAGVVAAMRPARRASRLPALGAAAATA
ncbi:MAG: FtsX-like permease family protein [Acidimicrobiia bacterium]